MAKVTGFKHLFDYCPKLQKLFDEIKDFEDECQAVEDDFIAARRKLLRQSQNLERLFLRFTPTKKRFVGTAIRVIESLYWNRGLASGKQEDKLQGAVTMAIALLQQFNPASSGFIREFAAFAAKVHEIYDFNTQVIK